MDQARGSTQMRPRVTLGLLTVGLIAVGILIVWQFQPTAAACATSSIASITSRDVPGFVTVVDSASNQLPSSFGRKIPALHLTRARFVGLVTTLVNDPAYRADLDSAARSLGYEPGAIPLLPLVGKVVADHPTAVLEIWETILVFDSSDDAADYLQVIRDSNGSYSQLALTSASTVAFVEPPPASGLPGEKTLVVQRQHGAMLLAVTLRGGASIGEEDAARVIGIAETRISRNCGFPFASREA